MSKIKITIETKDIYSWNDKIPTIIITCGDREEIFLAGKDQYTIKKAINLFLDLYRGEDLTEI